MKKVFKYIEESLVMNSSYIVAAISGGPDSMALLNILIQLRDKYKFNIVCAHVNHNIRKESEQEKTFLENYCNKNNIIFEYMKIEKYNNNNFHDQSRKIRYNFFESIIEKYNSKYLFTAHHGDDLMETILMRITRGSNLNGYSGFQLKSKRENYTIIRPLIFTTKNEILEYDINNDIPYVIDKSNEKDCYTRNRYRKYILPFLKQENKNVHKKYIKFSQELYKYEKFVETTSLSALNKIYFNNTLDIEKFLELDILIQEKVLEKILQDTYTDLLQLINHKHIEVIINLVKSNRPNSLITLPNNIIIRKEYNHLKFERKQDNINKYKLKLKDKIVINNNIIEIVNECNDTSNNCIRLNSEEIKLPLYIRNRCIGDKIEVKGLNGTKKIKDIFINSKIGSKKRDEFPILVDSNDKILWLPGLKKSKYDKSKNEKYDIIVRYY